MLNMRINKGQKNPTSVRRDFYSFFMLLMSISLVKGYRPETFRQSQSTHALA